MVTSLQSSARRPGHARSGLPAFAPLDKIHSNIRSVYEQAEFRLIASIRRLDMLSAEQNDLITRTNLGTAAGTLMRRYWQPAALVDELSGNRPVKPVRLVGAGLVAFTDEGGAYGGVA